MCVVAHPTNPYRHLVAAAVEALRLAPWLTRERVLRWGRAFTVLSLVLLAWDAVTHRTAGVTNAIGEHLGRDFVDFWSGARLAESGKAALAYNVEAFNQHQKALVGPASEFKLYSYPPSTMLLSWPLAALPYLPGLAVWTLLGSGLVSWLLSRLVGWQMAALAAIGAPAAYLNILGGQNGHFTAALLAGGLSLLDRRPVLAGVLLGLLAYKPQVGVLLPVALVAGSRWRSFAAAALTVIGLIAASFVLLGAEAWSGYLDQIKLETRLIELGDDFWHRMQTVFFMLRMFGTGLSAAYFAQACSAVLAVLALAVVWRTGSALELKAATLVVAMFLATPYAWDYDMVVLPFVAAWLTRDASAGRGFRAWEKTALCLLLAQPIMTMLLFYLVGSQVAPLVLWLTLGLLLRRALAADVDRLADSALAKAPA
jgi:hypothetical protein